MSLPTNFNKGSKATLLGDLREIVSSHFTLNKKSKKMEADIQELKIRSIELRNEANLSFDQRELLQEQVNYVALFESKIILREELIVRLNGIEKEMVKLLGDKNIIYIPKEWN